MKKESALYSIHRRAGVFYVQFRNPISRKWSSAKSTGQTDKSAALLTVASWLRDGVPTDKTATRRHLADVFLSESAIESVRKAPLTPEEAAAIVDILRDRGLVDVSAVRKGPGDVDFIAFLETFWDYDKSPYVKDRLAHGQSIGKQHCADMAYRAKLHWKPAFAGRMLSSVTKSDLKTFATTLSGKGLAPATINKLLIAGNAALTWAKASDLIPADPSEGLRTFSGAGKPRGVLEVSEAAQLFKREYWTDDRCYVANLTASVTGMRAGELLALKVQDIGSDRIIVSRAWGGKDGVKDTKNHGVRQVPLLPSIRRALLDLAATNPHGPSGFIFHGPSAAEPMDNKLFLIDFRRAFTAMRMDGNDDPQAREAAEMELEERNLVFHSWRHFYSSRMADSIDLRKLSTATGHKSMTVLEGYASHASKADFAEIGQAVENIFAPMLKDSKSAS